MTCSYFLDVLSQWCFIADSACQKLSFRYGPQVEFDYRFVPVAGLGVLPVSRAQQIVAYDRSKMISGVQTAPWIEENSATKTWEANANVMAAVQMGVDVEQVRSKVAEAALIRGLPMGRAGYATTFVAECFDLDIDALTKLVHGEAIRALLEQNAADFQELGLKVRPSFVLRNSIGDHTILGGAYRYEVLDGCIESLLSDETAYNYFAAHFGESVVKASA